MAAGTLQTINPLFIIIFAPVFAAIWVQLGARNFDPSAPVKFALGLILMGIGFYVMVLASKYVVAGEKVLPTWLILTYLFHTFGELCLSPVGLSPSASWHLRASSANRWAYGSSRRRSATHRRPDRR
jgi:POT family proton-dependent oligopeptide transporter